MNESQILNLAGDRVQQVGLWQDGSGGSGTCISNAIQWAGRQALDFEAEYAARDKVMEYLGLGTDVVDLFEWNDQKGRTASEVIEVLRACAVIEHARETPSPATSTASAGVGGREA